MYNNYINRKRHFNASREYNQDHIYDQVIKLALLYINIVNCQIGKHFKLRMSDPEGLCPLDMEAFYLD